MSSTIVTEEDIRQTLLENLDEGTTSKRELIRSTIPTRADADTTGSIVYALSGSPPRGYAIYTPGLENLSYYSPSGERIAHETDVSGVAEVNDVIQEVVSLLQDNDELTTDELNEQIEADVTIQGTGTAEMSDGETLERVLAALNDRGVTVENSGEDDSGEEEVVVRLAVMTD